MRVPRPDTHSGERGRRGGGRRAAGGRVRRVGPSSADSAACSSPLVAPPRSSYRLERRVVAGRVAAAAKGGARRRERAAARGWARARAADSRVVAAAAPRPSRAPATAAASRSRAVAPSSPATPLSRGQTGTSSRRGTRWSGPTWRTVPSCTAPGPLSAAVTAWRDGGRSSTRAAREKARWGGWRSQPVHSLPVPRTQRRPGRFSDEILRKDLTIWAGKSA